MTGHNQYVISYIVEANRAINNLEKIKRKTSEFMVTLERLGKIESQAQMAMNKMAQAIRALERARIKQGRLSQHHTTQLRKLKNSYARATKEQLKLEKATRYLNQGMGRQQGAAKRSLLTMMKWAFGWTIVYGAIRSVQNAIRDSIGAFLDHQREMARVETVTRAAGGNIEKIMRLMGNAALDYGMKSVASFSDTRKALYFLGSAGLDVKEQLTGFKHVMDTVVAVSGSVAEVARLVSGVYNVFGDRIEGATTASEKFQKISDMIVYTYSKEQVELSEMFSAMQFAASAADVMNVKFETLIATIGFLNTGMLKGSKTGTALMNAFVMIAQKSDVLRTKLGLVFDPTKPLDFVDIMEQLNRKVGEGAISLETTGKIFQVFGRRGGRAIAAIISHFDEWKKDIDDIGIKSEGMAEKLKDIMENTVDAQLKITKNILVGLGTQLLMVFGGKDTVEALKNFNKWLRGFSGNMGKIIEIFAKLNYVLEVSAIRILQLSYEIGRFFKSEGIVRPFHEGFENFLELLENLTLDTKAAMKQREEWKRSLIELMTGKKKGGKEIAEKPLLLFPPPDISPSLGKHWDKQIEEAGEKRDKLIADVKANTAELKETFKNLQGFTEGEAEAAIRTAISGTRIITDIERKLEIMKEAYKYQLLEVKGYSSVEIALKKVVVQREKIKKISEDIVKSDAAKKKRLLDEIAKAEGKEKAKLHEEFNKIKFVEKALTLEEIRLLNAEQLYEWTIKSGEAKKAVLELQKRENALELEHLKIVAQIRNEMVGGLEDVIKSTGKFEDALKNIGDTILKDILNKILRMKVIKPIIDPMFAGIETSMLTASAEGSAMYYKAIISATNVLLKAIKLIPGMGGGPSAIPTGDEVDKTSRMKTFGKYLGYGAMGYAMGGGGIGAGLSMIGGHFGPVGAFIGGLIGKLFAPKPETQKIIEEQTQRTTSKIDITNKQLEIVNRNLSAMRRTLEPYPMPQSYYFRERTGTGVQVQTMIIQVGSDAQGKDVVMAIKEQFAVDSQRIYQRV